MPITPFLAGQVFEPEAIRDMSTVLVAVCGKLGLTDRSDALTQHELRQSSSWHNAACAMLKHCAK